MIEAGTRAIRDAGQHADTSDAWRWIRREFGGVVRTITRSEKLFVAALNGSAAGVGLAFALACDLVVASERALLVPAFGRLGLVPEVGTSWTLARRLGPQGALAFWLEGRPVGAPEALQLGLVQRVVEHDTLLDEAGVWCDRASQLPRHALAMTKPLLRAAADAPFEHALVMEEYAEANCFSTRQPRRRGGDYSGRGRDAAVNPSSTSRPLKRCTSSSGSGCGIAVVSCADDRELPLAHGLEQRVARGAVEAVVAQRDPAGIADRLVEMAHRGIRLAGRRNRSRVERVVLALDRAALARIAQAREALGQEPAHAGFPSRGEQRVRPLRAQPVGLRERAVHRPGETHVRERGRLMDDRLGLALEHRLPYGARVEQVERDRPGAGRPHPTAVLRRPVRADHLVAPIEQLSNEPAADGTTCSRDEYAHHGLLCRVSGPVTRAPRA